MADTSRADMKKLCEIDVSSKVIAIDFDNSSDYIRFNTAKYEYMVYQIELKDIKIEPKQITDITALVSGRDWSTHTIPFSP